MLSETRKEGMIEIAKRMLITEDFTFEEIEKYTELSFDELKDLVSIKNKF